MRMPRIAMRLGKSQLHGSRFLFVYVNEPNILTPNEMWISKSPTSPIDRVPNLPVTSSYLAASSPFFAEQPPEDRPRLTRFDRIQKGLCAS